MSLARIPLPESGWLPGMAAGNALSGQMLDNAIKKVQAQYAPLTTQAEAASKLAYANLMGPQFLAKLMGNQDILANMSPEQRNAALQSVYAAGNGAGTGNAILNNPNFSALFQPQNPLQNVVNNIKSAFGFGSPSQQNQQRPTNALMNAPVSSVSSSNSLSNADSGMRYDRNGNNIVATPQEIDALVNRGNQNPNSFAENAATYQQIKEQGKEKGKNIANAIEDMDTQYQQAVQSEVPLQHMNEIVTSPAFRNLRNFPAFLATQLNVKSKIGTPEEQRLIGDFQTTALNAVAQTVMGFRGRILDKEVQIANQMKVSPNDTIGVILGKLPSIESFNEMTKQRSRMASQLMDKYHLTRGDALEQADKQINGDEIRRTVESKLDYPVTIRNKKTGQEETVLVSEARKRGVPNV